VTDIVHKGAFHSSRPNVLPTPDRKSRKEKGTPRRSPFDKKKKEKEPGHHGTDPTTWAGADHLGGEKNPKSKNPEKTKEDKEYLLSKEHRKVGGGGVS